VPAALMPASSGQVRSGQSDSQALWALSTLNRPQFRQMPLGAGTGHVELTVAFHSFPLGGPVY
jgi:hypothetical protein